MPDPGSGFIHLKFGIAYIPIRRRLEIIITRLHCNRRVCTSKIEFIFFSVPLRNVVTSCLFSGGAEEILIHSFPCFLTWIYLNIHIIYKHASIYTCQVNTPKHVQTISFPKHQSKSMNWLFLCFLSRSIRACFSTTSSGTGLFHFHSKSTAYLCSSVIKCT